MKNDSGKQYFYSSTPLINIAFYCWYFLDNNFLKIKLFDAKKGANLISIIIAKISTGIATSNCAIWDKFNEQHKQVNKDSVKKLTI